MTTQRTANERAEILAFGLCRDPDGPAELPSDVALSTHERPVLEEAARRLRVRLALVESAITRKP